MAIERWRLFSELMSLRREMDKLFEDFMCPSRFFAEAEAPVIGAYHTPNEVVVKAALPGLKPEDISIDITGDTLTIKGEGKVEQEIKKEDYLYRERRFGAFSRSIALPGGLQPDKAEATMEDGVLTLSSPALG